LQGKTRKLTTTIVVLALLVSVLSVGVLAVFTDSTSVGANTFATGDVDLSTSPTSALVTFSAMLPGDQVTAPITVTNDGSADLRYAITSTTTENTLAAQLDLTVKSGVATCTNAGFGASGTVLYGPADVGNTTAVNLVGNPTQGAQAGDRAVAAGANETLCFNVSLPLSTGNAFASLSSTATFTFQAEQTQNNP
jgi:predicted ribosomally synthesized peptide with SipW-like signal peptide